MTTKTSKPKKMYNKKESQHFSSAVVLTFVTIIFIVPFLV